MRSLEPASVIFVLTAVLLATVCLAACSGKKGEEGATAAAPAEEGTISGNDFESGDTGGWKGAEGEDEESDEDKDKDEDEDKEGGKDE